MTLSSNQVRLKEFDKSLGLVLYYSSAEELGKRISKIAAESFNIQIGDCRRLHPISIRARILAGNYPRLEIGGGLPKPFHGTRSQLLNIIDDTIQTLHHLDYYGLTSLIKLLDQLERGKTFREITIDS